MKFLVAVDGSDEADRALAHATDVADGMGASLTVVYSVDPAAHDVGGSDPIATATDADERLIVESVEDAEDRGLDVLDDAADLAEDLGHDVETELLYGDPVRAITEYAQEERFDAIFVGHRGRTERADLMLGSVAKAVVERSNIPVTVVR